MTLRRYLFSLLAAAFWLTAVNRGVSQVRLDSDPRPSRPDDVRPKVERVEDALRSRLGINHQLNDTEKLVQKMLNSLTEKDKENLVRAIQNDPKLRNQLTQELLNNPKFRDQVQQSVDQNRLTDATKELLKKVAKSEQPPSNSTVTPPTPGTTPPALGTTPPAPGEPKKNGEEASGGDENAEESSGLKRMFTKALPKAADLLSDMGLTNDPDFLRTLFRGKMPDDDGGLLSRAINRATEMAKDLPLDKMFSGEFPKTLDVSLPKFDFSFGGVSGPGGRGGSNTESSDGAGYAVIWLVVVIVFLGFLWKGKGLLLPSAGKGPGAWKIGPWPVRPERVRTRGDLVKAFEYLAFLVLGLAARPRNHLDLAADLSATADQPDRRTAFQRLAHLYERARYAPEQDALPDDDLQAARNDLTFLAGVVRA